MSLREGVHYVLKLLNHVTTGGQSSNMNIMFHLHCDVGCIWTRSLRPSVGTPQDLLLLFSVFFLGWLVQHWVVFSQYLYVVVLICCVYKLLCCYEMIHIAFDCHLLLLGQVFASIQ